MTNALKRAVTVCAFGLALAAAAQTYTIKKIRIEGATATDISELMRVVNLQPGSITKTQIEAALQRLGDTGLFTDLRYKIGADELVIIVTEVKTAQELPVRYANFVWWQPAELETMVEAQVPLFHGKLPLSGSLTEQVKSALVEILRAKGINASVDTMPSTDVPNGPIVATSLSISRPQILVGDVTIAGAPPQARSESSTVQTRLHGEEFVLQETPAGVKNGVMEIFRLTGYLDASATDISFSAPRKDDDRYWIDINVPLTGGVLYHVSRVDVHGAAPLFDNDLKPMVSIKPGDGAGAFALGEQRGKLVEGYHKRGYLDAEAKLDTQKDAASHTIAYTFNMMPGQQYRVMGINASGLSAEDQAAFTRSDRLMPGTLLDDNFTQILGREIAALHSLQRIVALPIPDRENKTVTMVLKYLPAGR